MSCVKLFFKQKKLPKQEQLLLFWIAKLFNSSLEIVVVLPLLILCFLGYSASEKRSLILPLLLQICQFFLITLLNFALYILILCC